MLDHQTLARVDADAAAFAGARPFRHAVIDSFLDPDACSALLQQFPGFEARYALNEMGEVGGKAVRSAVRDLGPAYAAIDDFIQTPDFLGYVSRLTGIPDLLYDPDYEGGGTHENSDGQGLDAHVDFNYHPRTGWHRRLNLIIYLNPEWQSDWGGALQLVEDPWSGVGQRHEVLPLFNRCVVFETNEVSWHGFEAIRLPEARKMLSRKSFAIYLYTRERPAEETAPPHATVYVPEGMPDDLAAGSVLDDERLMDLRVRFARLRGQLRFLYEREAGFSRQIEQLKLAVEQARAAQRVDLQGYARVDSVAGSWPDGWCGTRLEVDFTPSKSVRGVLVDLWVPPQLSGPQKLVLRCAGAEQVVELAPGARRSLRLASAAAVGASVTLSIEAALSWQPAAPGSGGDERPLAWRLLGITLEH